ncbi:hypothetical protein RYX36_005263, partial [Vicia faba]
KHGTKKLSANTYLFGNLSKAKFGSGPEPNSGYYVAVGDSNKDAYTKSKSKEPNGTHNHNQYLVVRREHVYANKIYNTRARFSGKMKVIQIDCGGRDHSKLCFTVFGLVLRS